MSRELSEWFLGAAAKRLSEVEVNPGRSNQHEFQATTLVREFLGETKEKRTMPARFVYLDDETEPLVVSSWVTYYDARANNPTRNPEYRLYYPDNDVTRSARSGDTLVIASLKDGSCLVAICQATGTYASQLLWLFDIHLGAATSFTVADREAFSGALTPVDVDVLLKIFGLEVELNTPRDLELVTAKFGTSFPTTAEFSAFARECSDGPHPLDDPDGALLSWWDTEYRLFQAFERATVQERLSVGFDGPSAVEDFLRFSLSVQNRRKSRSGYAFEHHIASVLIANNVEFVRQAVTERGSKPDFLLPNGASPQPDESCVGGPLRLATPVGG